MDILRKTKMATINTKKAIFLSQRDDFVLVIDSYDMIKILYIVVLFFYVPINKMDEYKDENNRSQI